MLVVVVAVVVPLLCFPFSIGKQSCSSCLDIVCKFLSDLDLGLLGPGHLLISSFLVSIAYLIFYLVTVGWLVISG